MVSFVNPGTLQVQYNILNWSISNGVLPAFCGANLSLKQGRDAKSEKSWEKRMKQSAQQKWFQNVSYVRIRFQYCSICHVQILALSRSVPSAGGQQCSR